MKYTVEMGSGAMTYVPSFLKNGSRIQKLMRGYADTDKMVMLQAHFYFFKISTVG
jgi:hypothetical protein